MAAEVVPRDRHSERESHEDGTQSDGRQAAVKGDLASQGQTFGAQQTQKADSAGPRGETQRAPGERQQGGLTIASLTTCHRLAPSA